MMVVKFWWQVIVWTSSLKCLVIGSYVLFLRGTLILCAKLISSLLTVLSVVVFFLGGNVREPHWIHAFHSTGSFPVWLFNHTVFIGSNFYWPDSSQFLLARFEPISIGPIRGFLSWNLSMAFESLLYMPNATSLAFLFVVLYLLCSTRRNCLFGPLFKKERACWGVTGSLLELDRSRGSVQSHKSMPTGVCCYHG